MLGLARVCLDDKSWSEPPYVAWLHNIACVIVCVWMVSLSFKAADATSATPVVQSQGERLRETFNEFDIDNSGFLDRRELSRLIQKLMPDAQARFV